MSVTDVLIERNRQQLEGRESLPFAPTLRAIILTCSDHRVDPAHVLGLAAGEAVVIRNAGGRVTPAAIVDLAILATVGAIENVGDGFELIVMQHTDCGTSRLGGPEYRDLLAGHFGIEASDVPGRHVTDPEAAVKLDVQQLRDSPAIPDGVATSGIVYDVESGLAKVVVPTA